VKIDRFQTAVAVAGAAIALACLGQASIGQAGQGAARKEGITPARAREVVDQLAKDLREARSLAEKIGDKALREKMGLVLAQAELKARDLSTELAHSGRVAGPTAPPPLSADEFAKLLKGLSAETFDKDKAIYVENFCVARPLTCAQAAELLKRFDFDDARVKAVAALYPKLVDPNNFNDVLATFTFDGKKQEARKAVGLK
jgi:hypothetical protein